jgi:membrane protein DedA with SNARE-associated domain
LQPWDWLLQFAQQYGFLGVFIISALGSSTVIVPIPYTLVIYYLGALRVMNPILIALAGGLGSSIGVTTSYFLGYYGRAVVGKNEQKKMDFFVKILGGHMSVAVFVFSFTPLPDALIFMPLGISRYSLVKIWVPNLLGKLAMCYVLTLAGQYTLGSVLSVFGEAGGWLSFILTTGLLLLILIVVLKLDWERIFERYFLKRLKQYESNR